MPFGVSQGLAPGDVYALALLCFGGAVFIAIAALSHQEERAFSAAIIYLGLGVLASAAMSVLGVTRLDPLRDELVVERLCELALVVAVFAAGLGIGRVRDRRSWVQVAVLLAVVMPASIALVALFASLTMGLSLGAAILLGAILAPTDPVLAGEVGLGAPGEDDDAPEPRFSLHTEAGANDGLASPFVLLGLFVAGEGGTGWIGEWVLADLLYGVGLAVALGAAAGWGIAALTVRLRAADLLDHDYDGFVALASVLLIYGGAELLDLYGLVAVFVAGYSFRRYEFGHEVNRRVHDGAHMVGRFLELAVLLLLGSLVTTAGLAVPGVAGWLLAPLLILVVRPVLVLALTDRRLMPPKERRFLAWFGVRGVAALFYAAYVAHAGVLSDAEAETVVWTVLVCVIVSIVLHGISATPLTRRWLAHQG